MLGSLVVSLGLNSADFVGGLSKSEQQAKNSAARIARSIDQAAKAVAANFAVLATAGVAAFNVLNQQADRIAGFQDLAEKIGDTAEAVATLQTAANLSETSLDTVAAASVKLTAALSKTDDESKAVAQGIKALGLNFEEFKGLSPVEQVDAVAKALAKFENGAKKTAVAVAILGKSGAELLPFLNDLADEGERQVRLTADQIAAADAYSKAQARARSELEGFVQQITAQALPAMTQTQEVLAQLAKDEAAVAVATGLVNAAMSIAVTVFQALSVAALDVGFVFKQTGGFVAAYAAVVERLLDFDFKGAKSIGEFYRADAEKARAALDSVQKKILDIGKTGSVLTGQRSDAFSDPRSTLFGTPRRPELDISGLVQGGKAAKAKQEIDKVAEAIAGAQRELALFGQSDTFAKVLDLEGLGASTAQLDVYRRALEQIDALKLEDSILQTVRALEVQRDEFGLTNDELTIQRLLMQGASQDQLQYAETILATVEAQRRQKDQAERLRELLDATPSAQLERDRADMALLTREFEAGRLSVEKYTEAVVARLGLVGTELQKLDPFATKAAESIQDALGDGLYDALNGNFKNIGDSFVQTINRMVAEAAAADLAKALLGDLVKGGSGTGVLGGLFNTVFGSVGGTGQAGGGGGFLGSLIGSAAGLFGGGGFSGITSGSSSLVSFGLGGGRAIGGPTMPNTLYQVGERRPEVFDDGSRQWLLTGSRRGRVDPNPQFGGGRGAMTVNNTFVVQGQTDRRSQSQIAASAARGVASANARNN